MEIKNYESLLLNSALQFYEALKKQKDILDAKHIVLQSLNKIIIVFLEGPETSEEKLYLCGTVLTGTLTAIDEKCKMYEHILSDNPEDTETKMNLEICKQLKETVEKGTY